MTKLDIMGFAAEPWFVPDTTGLKDQLNQFLKRKAQMALVVDEYGEVQGLITLEDILEEIVGQIADEHDTHEAAIRPQADGTVNVDGTVAIRDLNRQMDWTFPTRRRRPSPASSSTRRRPSPSRDRSSPSTAIASRSCARPATRSPRCASARAAKLPARAKSAGETVG